MFNDIKFGDNITNMTVRRFLESQLFPDLKDALENVSGMLEWGLIWGYSWWR